MWSAEKFSDRWGGADIQLPYGSGYIEENGTEEGHEPRTA